MSIIRIFEWARRHPGRTAVVWNGRKVSYARFACGIDAARKAFLPLAIPAGSTAVILAKSLLETWTASLALRLLGVDTVAVPSIETARDLQLQNVGAILVSEDMMEKSRLPDNPWPHAMRIRILADSFQVGGLAAPPPIPAEEGPQGGHVLYTSGTTGVYKKLLLDGGLIARRDAWLLANDSLDYDSTWQLAFLGMWTYAGFVIPSAIWEAGGCAVFDQRIEWADHYFDQDIAHGVAMPHMLEALLDPARPAPSRKCRALHVGGGFIPPAMAQQAVERLTDRLLVTYAASELYLRVLESDYAAPDDLHWLSPVMGRGVDIVDDASRPCPPGQEGHLRVHLDPLDSRAYLDDPEATARVFRDGCFHPGDMAIQREDGRFRILGRSVNVLNLQGQKVATAPIELQLQERIGARAVCLFSSVTPSGENEIVAALEMDQLPDGQDLCGELRELTRCALVRIATLAEFPRTGTGTGKVDRGRLRALVFPDPAHGND